MRQRSHSPLAAATISQKLNWISPLHPTQLPYPDGMGGQRDWGRECQHLPPSERFSFVRFETKSDFNKSQIKCFFRNSKALYIYKKKKCCRNRINQIFPGCDHKSSFLRHSYFIASKLLNVRQLIHTLHMLIYSLFLKL